MTDPLSKADPGLSRRLAVASGAEPIAAILELEAPEATSADVPLGGTLEATALRRTAREHAAEALARCSEATLAALVRLGLAPRGGRNLPYVAVRGPANAIRAALSLPGVVSAALDATPTPDASRPLADANGER